MNSEPVFASLILRFAIIFRGLRLAVATRGRQTNLPRPLLDAIHAHLTRIIARFETIATNPSPTPTSSASRPYKPRPERPYVPAPLPRHYAWLLRLVPATDLQPSVAALPRAEFEALLSDPAMRALIEQNEATGPLLRTICRMLGIPRPPHLPLASPKQATTPARPRKPRRLNPPRPSPYPEPPRPPTPWDQRRAFIAMFGSPRLST